MEIKNKILEQLLYTDIEKESSCTISNSIIKEFNLIGIEVNFNLVIENSIIEDFRIHSAWFRSGLTFRNNHVMNYVDYQMGGHNNELIVISGNVFNEFVSFFDCNFTNTIVIERNIFLKGSNLLGNREEGFRNIFGKDLILNDNIGKIDVDGIGLERKV